MSNYPPGFDERLLDDPTTCEKCEGRLNRDLFCDKCDREITGNDVLDFIADNENVFEREHRSNGHECAFRTVNYGDQAPTTRPYVEYCFLCEDDAKEELTEDPRLLNHGDRWVAEYHRVSAK